MPQPALCLLFGNDLTSFPEALKFIPHGIVVGNLKNLPQGWELAQKGRLGLPHGFLFREEIERDVSDLSGLVFLPPPLSDLTQAKIGANFVSLVFGEDKTYLMGRKDRNFFMLPAVDLNQFRQSALQRQTSLASKLFRGRGVVVFYCQWQGGHWNERLFSELEWLDWGSLNPSRHSSPSLPQSLPILVPKLKKESIELGRQRCQPESTQGLNTSPAKVSHSQCSEEAYIASIKGVAKRNLAASMQGESQLNHHNLTLRLVQGRLASFPWGEAKHQAAGQVQSWIEVEGRKIFFVSVSSVAIEGDNSWGLRESLVAESPLFVQSGRLVVDYLFSDHTDELSVSLSVRWPVFRRPVTLTGWAPWELPLGTFGLFQKYEIETLDEDGWKPTRDLPVVARCLALRLSQQNAGLGFRFFQGQSHRPHFLPIRKQGGTVWINPEGSYDSVDSRELEGYTEHHNWALFRAPQRFSDWPPEPDDLFVPPLIQK